MKKTLLVLLILFIGAINAYCQTSSDTTNVVLNKIDAISSDIQHLKEKVNTLEKENTQIKKDNSNLHQSLNKQIEESNTASQRLQSGIDENSSSIIMAQGAIDTQAAILEKKSFMGIILALGVLLLSSLLTLIFHKKVTDKITELKHLFEKINGEIVSKFSIEMSNMQKLSTSISALSSAGATSENEQDLIKTLADRITFMEMTLYKMDNGIKGHKQLSRSISQMKDNMLASGYELVDMLGKPYSDGMKATASFEDDDTLEEGVRIITKVIKPQINYKGVMIQNAQITVSQNI